MTDNLHGLNSVEMIEPLDGLGGGNMNIDDGTSNTDSDDEGSKVSSDAGTGEPKVSPEGEYNTISTVIYRWADGFSLNLGPFETTLEPSYLRIWNAEPLHSVNKEILGAKLHEIFIIKIDNVEHPWRQIAWMDFYRYYVLILTDTSLNLRACIAFVFNNPEEINRFRLRFAFAIYIYISVLLTLYAVFLLTLPSVRSLNSFPIRNQTPKCFHCHGYPQYFSLFGVLGRYLRFETSKLTPLS